MKHRASSIFFTLAGIILPASQALAQASDLNPIQAGSGSELYGRIIRAFLGVIGTAALLFVVIGGFTMLTSQGNPEKIKAGRDTILWAAIGLLVAFSSWIILRFVITSIITPTS